MFYLIAVKGVQDDCWRRLIGCWWLFLFPSQKSISLYDILCDILVPRYGLASFTVNLCDSLSYILYILFNGR